MHSSASALASALVVQHTVRALLCDVVYERLSTVLIRTHRITDELVRFERRSSGYPLRMFSCVMGCSRHSVDGEFLLSRDPANVSEFAIFGVFLLGFTDIRLGNRVSTTSLG